MRALEPITLPTEGQVRHGHYLNHYGPYCALSEVPLLDQVWLWHATTNQIVQEPVDLALAGHVLPLSHNCHGAFDKDAPPSSLENMLLPHRDPIRIIGEGAHFRYVLEDYDYEVHYKGKVVESKRERFAVVVAQTPEAQKTIDHFALNTPYHDAENRLFRVPQYDHNTLADLRVQLRTRTWTTAEHMVKLLDMEKDTPRFEGVCQQIRHISVAAGHWSVWVTLFWEKFHDLRLIEKLFWPSAGQSYFRGFPNTSRHQVN